MALLPIRKYPDPCLKEACASVETIDDQILTLMEDMAETKLEQTDLLLTNFERISRGLEGTLRLIDAELAGRGI